MNTYLILRIFCGPSSETLQSRLIIQAMLHYHPSWLCSGCTAIVCYALILSRHNLYYRDNVHWLSGIIFLAYGLASPAFSSETATLAINGRISPPTCSMAMVNGQPQQHCGQLTYNVDTRHLFSSPVKGVTTEVVVAGSDSKRRIVLNRYD